MVVLSMKTTIYKEGDGYILATGESPKEFKGVLFVVWEGSIDNLTEGVRTLDQLKKLEETDDIPDEWLDALADAAGVCLESFDRDDSEPETEPEPVPTSSRVRKTTRRQGKSARRQSKASAARRDTPMDEFIGHCAVGTDPITAAVASGVFDSSEDEPTPEFSFNHFWLAIDVIIGVIIYLYVFL